MFNWKTTLAGIGAGALNLIANGHELPQVALSAGLTLLGILAKDLNNTGGTRRLEDKKRKSSSLLGGK